MVDNFRVQNRKNTQNSQHLPSDLIALSANTENIQISANHAAKSKHRTNHQRRSSNSRREGDWTCLICKNLNFSFRAECNRCGLQSKNQISTPFSQFTTDSFVLDLERQPLKDVTNIQHLTKADICLDDILTVVNNQKKKPLVDNFAGFDAVKNTLLQESKFHEGGYESNFGFESAILLTPPRLNLHMLGLQESTDEKYDLNRRLIPPYQSPQQELPSISPILRKVFGDGANHNYEDQFRRQTDTRLNCKRNLYHSENYGQEHERNSPRQAADEQTSYFKEIENFLQRESHSTSIASISTTDSSMHEGSNHPSDSFSLDDCRRMILLPTLEGNDVKHSHYPQVQQHQHTDNHMKKEKRTDWICEKCRNLNYSFRKVCNRCQFKK